MSAKVPTVLKAGLVIEAILLALGFEEILQKFSLNLPWTQVCVLISLIILVVWIGHLLVSYEDLYEGLDAKHLGFNGLAHQWTNIIFVSLVYMACCNPTHYWRVLSLMCLITLLDIPSSFLDWRYPLPQTKNPAKYWLVRDAVLCPILLIMWYICPFNAKSPRPFEAIIFLATMGGVYITDMWFAGLFYGTRVPDANSPPRPAVLKRPKRRAVRL